MGMCGTATHAASQAPYRTARRASQVPYRAATRELPLSVANACHSGPQVCHHGASALHAPPPPSSARLRSSASRPAHGPRSERCCHGYARRLLLSPVQGFCCGTHACMYPFNGGTAKHAPMRSRLLSLPPTHLTTHHPCRPRAAAGPAERHQELGCVCHCQQHQWLGGQ